jgi:hypothetical protein
MSNFGGNFTVFTFGSFITRAMMISYIPGATRITCPLPFPFSGFFSLKLRWLNYLSNEICTLR